MSDRPHFPKFPSVEGLNSRQLKNAALIHQGLAEWHHNEWLKRQILEGHTADFIRWGDA